MDKSLYGPGPCSDRMMPGCCLGSSRSTPISKSLCTTLPSRQSLLLPSLFVIGSIKTGTTSLWANLVDAAAPHTTPGKLTHKGDVSRKEKDFFGDPSMWRLGHQWYEKIWPECPDPAKGLVVAIDATPAYHVWYDAPKNMASFFGPLLPALRH